MALLGALTFIFGLNGYLHMKHRNDQLMDLASGKGWATATVTSSYDVNKKDPGLAYKYEVSGKNYTGYSFVPFDEYKNTVAGATITINYLPSDPSVSAYNPEDQALRFGFVPKVALLITCVGAFSACLGIYQGMRYGWLSRQT